MNPAIRALLADLDIPVASVLRRAGLPGDLFARDRIALDGPEYFALWQALDDEAGREQLPLEIGAAMSVEVFDPLVFAVLCSPDLNTAAGRLATYKRVIGPMRVDVRITPESTALSCVWAPGEVPPPLLGLTEVVVWTVLVRLATRHQVHPLRVLARRAPDDQEPYRRALGVPVAAGPSETVVFSAADAARPFLTANESMWRFFEPGLRRRLSESDPATPTADRVRAALLELLPTGRSSAAAVAGELAMSTRTLQRRLHEERTSFHAVLTATRTALARHYLANTALSTGEIAFLLGYTDPTSFRRAFRGWTGQPPTRARSGAGRLGP